MTYLQALIEATEKFKKIGFKEPVLEAQALLCLAVNQTREVLLAHLETELVGDSRARWDFLLNLRAQHIPLALLAGHKEFYGLDFIVSAQTLIPRPATELLVEKVLENQPAPQTLVDLGTGSGCIAIAILKNWPATKGYAIDISKRALKIAQFNAQNHQVASRLKFLSGSLLTPLKNISLEKPWILTANLPYLDQDKKNQYQKNCPEITYEPAKALYTSEKGLALYFKLLRQLKKFKNLPQRAYFEIEPEQVADLTRYIFKNFVTASIGIEKDLQRQDRLITIIF